MQLVSLLLHRQFRFAWNAKKFSKLFFFLQAGYSSKLLWVNMYGLTKKQQIKTCFQKSIKKMPWKKLRDEGNIEIVYPINKGVGVLVLVSFCCVSVCSSECPMSAGHTWWLHCSWLHSSFIWFSITRSSSTCSLSKVGHLEREPGRQKHVRHDSPLYTGRNLSHLCMYFLSKLIHVLYPTTLELLGK